MRMNKISSKTFDNYEEMAESAENWEHNCSYTLSSTAHHGEHHIIDLPNLQLSYSTREGGYLNESIAPPQAISIGIVQECRDKACLSRLKLHQGQVVFFDDTQTFTDMSNDYIKVAILSIPITFDTTLLKVLQKALGMYLVDKDMILSSQLNTILEVFQNEKKVPDIQIIEKELIETVKFLLETEPLLKPKLTKGEDIALEICQKVYQHMDGKISISTFAKEYNISERTLQKSFKSLFGFSPKYFFRLLKLNHVRYDLTHLSTEPVTVQRIALKWGFMHMGRFSGYYNALFRETPSTTLKQTQNKKNGIIDTCAQRQEEM